MTFTNKYFSSPSHYYEKETTLFMKFVFGSIDIQMEKDELILNNVT